VNRRWILRWHRNSAGRTRLTSRGTEILLEELLASSVARSVLIVRLAPEKFSYVLQFFLGRVLRWRRYSGNLLRRWERTALLSPRP